MPTKKRLPVGRRVYDRRNLRDDGARYGVCASFNRAEAESRSCRCGRYHDSAFERHRNLPLAVQNHRQRSSRSDFVIACYQGQAKATTRQLIWTRWNSSTTGGDLMALHAGHYVLFRATACPSRAASGAKPDLASLLLAARLFRNQSRVSTASTLEALRPKRTFRT